jgi:hypothetical protein
MKGEEVVMVSMLMVESADEPNLGLVVMDEEFTASATCSGIQLPLDLISSPPHSLRISSRLSSLRSTSTSLVYVLLSPFLRVLLMVGVGDGLGV